MNHINSVIIIKLNMIDVSLNILKYVLFPKWQSWFELLNENKMIKKCNFQLRMIGKFKKTISVCVKMSHLKSLICNKILH